MYLGIFRIDTSYPGDMVVVVLNMVILDEGLVSVGGPKVRVR